MTRLEILHRNEWNVVFRADLKKNQMGYEANKDTY